MSGQERLYVVNVRLRKTICGKCQAKKDYINYHTTLAGMNVSLYFIVTLQRGVNFTQDEPFAIMILSRWSILPQFYICLFCQLPYLALYVVNVRPRKTICGKCQAKKDYMW
jgi:ribosomal protein L40E